jgi:four helix bundle protein
MFAEYLTSYERGNAIEDGGGGVIMPEARPPARSFNDLVVWQKAHALVLAVYRFTAAFPKTETYGLTSQMRRAAVSIPANIAEGFGKRSQADKARHLNIAEASVEESRYYLILARDLGYGQPADLMQLLEEVSRLLNSYARALLASGS